MSSSIRYSEYDCFAKIHDESWGPEVSESELPCLEQLLLSHLPKGAHILDLCCGTGQIAEKLLKKGYQVTGLDGSEEMLHYARKNAPGVEFILDDARLFKLPSTFHGVISTNTSLNHVTNLEELTCVFRNVYAALLANGLFVFSLRLEKGYQSDWWNNSMIGDVKDEYAWAMKRVYNPEERIGKVYITIFQLVEKNWQRSDKTWLLKGYSCTEVLSALKNEGFTEVKVIPQHDLAETREAGMVYFVCRKLSTHKITLAES